ncbi:MAG: universal stress protein [Alphaproteobacteria bacterium]
MFTNIVLGVDGSEHALKATDRACELARLCAARLVILTVAKPIRGVSKQVREYMYAEHIAGEPQYVLSEMAKSVLIEAESRARRAGLENVKTVVREGQPARRIVEYAKEHGADLIVLGSRGLGDIGGLLLGSVSHKVITLAECTCLIVK